MKNLKKHLALLLAVLITVLPLPITALAEGSTPEVESVEFQKISIMEGTSRWWSTYYDPETGEEYRYYGYMYMPQFTVTLKNGDVLNSEMGSINYNGEQYNLSYSDGQSYNNQWGAGIHTVTASILGFETSFEVEITETPVAEVEVEKVSIIEGMNRHKQTEYNPDTGSCDLEYYRYSYTPKYTVTLKSGEVINSEWGGITYNEVRYNLNYSDGQSYNNQWGVGKHTVTASIMGFETSFEVEITENPVAIVEVDNITIMEGTNCYKQYEYNPDTGSCDLEYYRYSYTPKYAVTLKNGEVLNSEWGSITYNSERYSLYCSDDQSYNNQWGLGTHTVTANVLGFETSFEVEIVKTPVEKVEFEKISFTEGTNGYINTNYNPDTGNYDLEYYRYSYTPRYTVTLKNGTVLTPDWSGNIYYDGKYFSLSYSDDQSYTNPWGVGTHTVTANILGFDTSFEVEITESPYVLLEILEVENVKENENCYINQSGNIIYSAPDVIFRVTDKDGKSFLASSIDNPNVYFSHNQEYEPWTVGGNNRFTLHYSNLSAEASVELQASSSFEYIEQNGGLYITGYTVPGQESLEIPSEIDGKPVIGVLSLGEYNVVSSLTSVTIPDSVTTVGDSAFLGDYKLETISIGSGVNYLNADMFGGCKNLNGVSVSKDNPYYCDEDGVVYNKQKTVLVVYPLAKGEDYTVPASVTNIDILNKSVYDFVNVTFAEGSKMFVTVDGVTYNADKTKVISCDKTKSGYYDMPDTVTEIAENAFAGCSELTGVKVSENVTSIVYMAFADCGSLSEITLPSKLVSIDGSAFAGCSQLGEVSLPSSLKTIGAYAFARSGLESISLPDSVEELGCWAFSCCESLASVKLSNKLTYLSKYTFEYCVSLANITIPQSVKGIGEFCFYYSGLTKVSIPDSVVYLENCAFYSCEKLEELSLGKGLTEISAYAFCNCGIKKLYLPQNINRISECAFGDCESLTDVEFTNSDIEIGDYAFSGCPIKELNLPDGIKNSGGTASFAGTDISKLSLPNSVTRIAYENFANCSNLSEIDIPTSVISMGGHAFDNTPWYDVQADGEVYLEHVFYNYKGEMPATTEITIKDGTTVIADYALEERTGLTKLTFPEGLKAIGSWALYNCTSIEEINIPSSVTDIDTSAFAGCSYLTAINVSDGNPNYKSIDGVLFSKDGTELLWCPKRESGRYEVPEGVTRIATGAFSDSGVTAVKIMNPDTELCEYSVGYRSDGEGWSEYFSQSFGWSGGSFEYNVVEIICPENSKAYAYAKENFMLATVPEEIAIETTDKEVNVSGTSDIISENTVINVQQKSTDEIIITDTNTDKYILETAVVFDISLEKDGIKVQPNGKLTVSIAVPETLDGAKCRVLYVDENGSITDMKAIYRDGRMIFETDHFSNYMLAETDYICGDVNGDDSVDSDDAIYLLYYTLLPDDYPINQSGDFNGDGEVNSDDAIYLLYHTLLPDDYPLK